MRSLLVRARALSFVLLAVGAASCKSEKSDPTAGETPPDSDAATNPPSTPSPYADVPVSETLNAPSLSAPVDLVRDDYGIPHIYGATDADVAYAQGYIMASDRWVQMELGRRQASGTLAEIIGTLSDTIIDTDIRYRTHHMRKNAETTWANMQASEDPQDKHGVALLKSFTLGVNAWQAELKAGKQTLPQSYDLFYSTGSVTPWSEIDSLALGDLQAFELAFDAETEIALSKLETAEATTFHGSADPVKASRDGFVSDYYRLAPYNPTYTVDGWGNAHIAALTPDKKNGKKGAGSNKGARPSEELKSYLALLTKDQNSVRGIGLNRAQMPDKGSNNWVVSGSLTASGHPMVANDTHLSLQQPSIFYFSHLESKEGMNLMGTQFPGIPLQILGMNGHMAWGTTVSYIDVTDVYAETIKDCASGKCVTFKGQDVALVPRVEHFGIGKNGVMNGGVDITYYDVPHHGPILVRSTKGVAEPLGTKELSVRYTGHEPTALFKTLDVLSSSKNVDEAKAGLEKFFRYGGQNWVMADDKGNILWTQTIRSPRRPKGSTPWRVMPGDGSAEWSGDHAPSALPASKNPAKGFLATANADPLGVTADNDPMNEPEVDGFPVYLGSYYDPGTRVSRITKRILAGTADGKKLTREDMASIQADAYSEAGEAISPGFLDGAKALAEEIATPSAHPELAPIVATMSASAKAVLAPAIDAVSHWSFDTPAGQAGETADQLRDSHATVVFAVFTTKLAKNVIGDELKALGSEITEGRPTKMLANLIQHPEVLKTSNKVWDDLTTAPVESKLYMLAKSSADALEWIVANPALGPNVDGWSWGNIHKLVSNFPVPIGLDHEPVPRHGGDGTVDVGHHGATDDDYTFLGGPAIRFVAEIDPDKGPIARNVIPGGEIFKKESPHFGDLFDLWTKNQTIDLAFKHEEIVPRAQKEQSTRGLGRLIFSPTGK